MQTHKAGKVIIVTFDREINMEIALEMEDEIKKLIRSGEKYLLFDLEKLNNLSSISVRIFTSTLREINITDGKLKIANMSSSIKKLFKAINLITMLSIYNSVESAIEDF